jgi:hypothetical protein
MNGKDIKALAWEKDKLISLGDGLYLNLRKSRKTYIIRRKHNGKRQVITLGKSPAISLREAKYKAVQIKMKAELSNYLVEELIDKYWNEIVIPESKVPKQVEGYLNLLPDFWRPLYPLKDSVAGKLQRAGWDAEFRAEILFGQ